jgi:hypothetical protein
VPALRTGRRRAAGQFALRLGDEQSTDVTVLAGHASGGAVYGDVVSETDGATPVTKKHLGPTRYESFALPVGIVMSTQLLDWLAASWGPQPPEKDGAVLSLDPQMTVLREAGFTEALVTETTFPTFDAASAEMGHVTVRVQPAAIEVRPGSGKLSLFGAKQKLWRTANFRVDIDGLDCKRVNRIESFTVRRQVEIQATGDGTIELVPGSVEFPDLLITLSVVGVETWADWHEEFVVQGHSDEGFERDGSLSFLSTDLKSELGRIDLHHLGIVRLLPAEDESMRMKAQLYCEEMVLAHPGGAP